MIAKRENTKPCQFKGESLNMLVVVRKSMVTKMNYKVERQSAAVCPF